MPDPAYPGSHPVGHETRDANPRAIVLSGLVLGATILVVHLVLWWAMQFLEERAERSDPMVSPLATRADPPSPRLQAAPAGDLEQYLAEQHRRLEQYGWVDRQEQIVHIPIERAMGLVVQRGLPAFGQPAADAPAGEGPNNEATGAETTGAEATGPEATGTDAGTEATQTEATETEAGGEPDERTGGGQVDPSGGIPP